MAHILLILWLLMPFSRVPMQPGVYLDDTPTEAEGYWVSADKIRFTRGLPQTMGGWEAYSSTVLNGVCRGLHAWADNAGQKWVGAATHLQWYLANDGLFYDCTPIPTRTVQSSLTFTTDGSTANVTLFYANHGMTAGQRFALLNPQFSTVGGTTVTGSYTVGANPGTSTLTYTAAQSSTAVATNVAILADTNIYLAPGLKDGAAGAGFGTGYFSGSVGTGTTWSTPTTGTNFPATTSVDNFGQNVVFNPRGGGIYELYPITSNSELTTNGGFAGSLTGWTASGFSYGSNNAVCTLSATSPNIQQSITLNASAYYEVEFKISGTNAGNLLVTLGPTTLTNAASASKTYKLQGWGGKSGGSSTLSFTGTSLSAALSSVTVTQLLNAQIIPAAPTKNTVMVVTGEKFIMVGGTIEIATGNFNPMHLRWSNIADEQTWAPNTLSPNLSSFYTLGEGSRIVGMKLCGSEVLVWTDTALYAGTYSTDSNIIYSFRLVGTGCGLIGPNAAAVIGSNAYWLSPQGTIFMYGGAFPSIIRSTMGQDMMNNLSFVQQDKIIAAAFSMFGDVIWLYPDERDGTNENSRYSLLCTAETGPNPQGAPNVGIFAPGTFTRTAWIDAGVLEFPLAVDADGTVYYQEKGNSANGGPINWSLETGDIQLGNGDTSFLVQSFIPDFATLLGGCQMYVQTKLYPQSTAVRHGPFNVTSMSTKVDLMSDAPVGRNAAFIFQGAGAPATMRTGRLMFTEEDTGMIF